MAQRLSKGRGSGRVGLACTVLLFLLTAAPLSAAAWYEEYDRGLKRLRKGDAAGAATAFEAALSARSAPGRRTRAYGVRFIDYYPHLMLGKAYLQLGRHQDAVRELEAAQAAGAAPPSDVRAVLQEARQAQGSVEPSAIPVTEAGLPPAPYGLQLIPEGVGGQVRITWEASVKADHYLVQQAVGGSDWPAGEGTRAEEASLLFTGLPKGEIRGRVRAVSLLAGAGPWSSPVSLQLEVGEAEARTAGEKFAAGRSSMERGRFTEAIASLTEAASVMKNHTDCLAMIGTCQATLYFLKNDRARKEEALRWYRRLLEVDPSFRLDPQRVSPKIVQLLDGLR